MVTVQHSGRVAIRPRFESSRRRAWLAQISSFGLVGGIAFLVDFGIYNVLRASVLSDSPIWSKVVSVAVATMVAWIGNRHVTFRATRGRPALREAILFGLMNVVGLLIAAACLFVSHYVLGFTSQLADNISGNGIGLVLGTAFRFVAYRFLVFRPASASVSTPAPIPAPAPSDGLEPVRSGGAGASISHRNRLSPETVSP